MKFAIDEISNPKPDLLTNVHTKFGENPMIFIQVIVQMANKKPYGRFPFSSNRLKNKYMYSLIFVTDKGLTFKAPITIAAKNNFTFIYYYYYYVFVQRIKS